MKFGAKKAASFLGAVVSVIGIGWVLYLAYLKRDGIAELEFPIWQIVGYAFLYALSLYLLAWNWADIVHIHDGPDGAPKRLLQTTFLRSQIWKYVPGNVFHYVGRHLAGKMAGASSAALMKSTVTESVALVGAALLLSSVLLLASDFRGVGIGSAETVWLCASAGVLAATLMSIWYHVSDNRQFINRLMIIMARALLFLTALGILTFLIADGSDDAALIIGATSVAWLVGFVTPGSPGGIGTREAVLVLLLEPTLGEPVILGASLVLRAVTMGGDLLAYAIGSAIGKSGEQRRLPKRKLS